VGKQLSATISLPESQLFKRVVLVECFRNGVWAVGFVTGRITDARDGGVFLKIFIPTSPTPASGFLVVTKESQTVDPGWTIEEGIKAIISGGIIGPDEIKKV
jgi:uncharacterized membrane protein